MNELTQYDLGLGGMPHNDFMEREATQAGRRKHFQETFVSSTVNNLSRSEVHNRFRYLIERSIEVVSLRGEYS